MPQFVEHQLLNWDSALPTQMFEMFEKFAIVEFITPNIRRYFYELINED